MQILILALSVIPIQDSNTTRIKELKSELRDLGVRVSATYVALRSESELRSQLSKVRKLKRGLLQTGKQMTSAEKQIEQNKASMSQLTQLNAELNARLTQVRQGDVTTNNKLVGAINSNVARLKLLDEQRLKIEEATRSVRASTNQAQADYVKHVLSLRSLADDIEADYEDAQDDAEVQKLVSELSKLADKKYALQPSRAFATSLKQIDDLEKTIFSQAIKLRRNGDTFYVSVVVNGKAREMVLDSGASLIALPWTVAKDLSVKIKPSDRPIRLQLADGRQISGTLVVLENVRVSGFEVGKVEAAVLGPEARFAEPLLGMSFLKHFKFEIKPNESTLTLIRTGGGSRASRALPAK
ncbi:MAG: TIGR02281 family clan AA aspartic protease [Planctomycetaceae bacterium]